MRIRKGHAEMKKLVHFGDSRFKPGLKQEEDSQVWNQKKQGD